MLYADLDERMYPPGWEEAEYLTKQLKQVSWSYQMVVQRKMVAGLDGPDHKFAIIKWGIRVNLNDVPKRDVVWEGSEFSELTGMLRLLIATETARVQEQANQG